MKKGNFDIKVEGIGEQNYNVFSRQNRVRPVSFRHGSGKSGGTSDLLDLGWEEKNYSEDEAVVIKLQSTKK